MPKPIAKYYFFSPVTVLCIHTSQHTSLFSVFNFNFKKIHSSFVKKQDPRQSTSTDFITEHDPCQSVSIKNPVDLRPRTDASTVCTSLTKD